MKKFYSQFRFMLMTFALGLASVLMTNGSLQSSDETSIKLPQVSKSNILYFKVKKLPYDKFGAGSGSNLNYDCQKVKCEGITVIKSLN